MQISFRFNADKSLQVVAYFLRLANAPIDKAKLMKLVFLSDRQNFITHGLPITGDRQCAMKLGPVPSNTLDLVDGECYPINEKVYNYIQLNNYSVSLANSPGENLLSAEERSTLDLIWQQHGQKDTMPLCRETHRLPEYKDTYVEGTSTTIPYERIAKYSGNPARFRLGRPVISPEMAEKIVSPFPPESNL
jgi:hypothetical protein